MSRPCTICASAESHKINAELLVPSNTIRGIARRRNLSEDALTRHASNCVPKRLAKAAEAIEAKQASTWASQVNALKTRTERILDDATKSNDPRTALAAVKELRGLLELLGRASGELQPASAVTVNVGAAPAAGPLPGQSLATESAEAIAALLAEELMADLGAEKFAQVARLLVAGLPVETTGEVVPAAALQITSQADSAPPIRSVSTTESDQLA
jgi:hypothetical protein